MWSRLMSLMTRMLSGRTATALAAAATAVLTSLTVSTHAGHEQAAAPGVSGPAPATALVGAAKTSLEPRPEDYGGTWERDRAQCARMDADALTGLQDHPDHLASTGSPWPENPDCLYMGGFGLGPANPITAWDQEYGLWVRSVAIGDGADTLVLTTIDGEGWFWDYAAKCADCGARQLAADLGAELGIDPSGFVFAATHAHSAPDFIGGWGFVPDWYMRQVTDAIRESVRTAVARQEPAVLEVGEELARQHNSERRDTYRSAEEQQLTWLRAYVPGSGKREPARTIATIGGYAAHPTTRGTNDGVAHADWPGVFERTLEDRFGGVGALFMTGLGNMSASGGTPMGARLAGLVPDVGDGTDADRHRRPYVASYLGAAGHQRPVDRARHRRLLRPAVRSRPVDDPHRRAAGHRALRLGVGQLGRGRRGGGPDRRPVRADQRARARRSPTSPTPSRSSRARW